MNEHNNSKSFLKYVANDIVKKYGNDLSSVALVFPNKRASLFLNQQLAVLSDKPMWSPAYITISDMFRQYSKRTVGDDIKLICDLHKSFVECTKTDETLDRFYGWGQLLLNDFDDIDKNMADAKKVFANLSNIHELDDISYLNEEQKIVLKRFFANFSEEHNSELKKRFITLWSNLYNIYKDYNKRLSEQGIAYEGSLYREVVEDENIEFEYNHYIFVGFNVLQQVEQKLFSKIQKIGKAKFYWDFDKYYMKGNEAGHYISQYLKYFPNEFDVHDADIYDNLSKKKDITYISASTENVQARYISKWMRQNNRTEDGSRTAIVLCDETLLQTVIHSIPPETKEVNVTTGYPLSQTPIASLIYQLIALQTNGYHKEQECFRLHHINILLRHPYVKYISNSSQKLYEELNYNRNYYPKTEELHKDDGLKLLFTDINRNENMQHAMMSWIADVLKYIATHSEQNNDPLFQESVFRSYTLINRIVELISSGELAVDVITLQRLITQIVNTTKIPFHGEPVVGTQIMGVLETRNLDFDHILILSCNEGNMPKGVDETSFIPHAIRRAYGLTTVDNKVSIFSYYFHRMIQRAKDVTILYNNSTEDGHTGEMSRFMIQLMVESGYNITRKSIQAGHTPIIAASRNVGKDDSVMRRLSALNTISPTAINNYMRCQLMFYYNIVCGIKEPDNEDEELMDNRTFGNIFHRAAELIYKEIFHIGETIHASALNSYIEHPEMLLPTVDKAFRKELFKLSDDNRAMPRYNGMQLLYREVILQYLVQLLKADTLLTPFRVIGVEEKQYTEIEINVNGELRTIKVGGIIDRLDEVENDKDEHRIRVVDYKTGRFVKTKLSCIDDVFNPDNILERHSDYYLQTLLYSQIVRFSKEVNPDNLPVSPTLLFIQNTGSKEYDPTLFFGKERITDAGDYYEEFKERLTKILEDIYNRELNFIPTQNQDICATCAYRKICKM